MLSTVTQVHPVPAYLQHCRFVSAHNNSHVCHVLGHDHGHDHMDTTGPSLPSLQCSIRRVVRTMTLREHSHLLGVSPHRACAAMGAYSQRMAFVIGLLYLWCNGALICHLFTRRSWGAEGSQPTMLELAMVSEMVAYGCFVLVCNNPPLFVVRLSMIRQPTDCSRPSLP